MSGKRSQDVGKDTERRVVSHLRGRGLAGVERSVRTGYRVAGRAMQDAGDLTGWPGVCVQVKSLRPANAAERAVPQWLAETELQRQQSGASVGLLIVRRWGTTDVGEWWVFLPARDLFALADAGHWSFPSAAPVRMELDDLLDLMQTWGWVPAAELEGMA